jgi:hypothetical protein
MNAWLIIGMSVLVMWTLWAFLNWIFNLLEIWHAARRGEDSQSDREKVSSRS